MVSSISEQIYHRTEFEAGVYISKVVKLFHIPVEECSVFEHVGLDVLDDIPVGPVSA